MSTGRKPIVFNRGIKYVGSRIRAGKPVQIKEVQAKIGTTYAHALRIVNYFVNNKVLVKAKGPKKTGPGRPRIDFMTRTLARNLGYKETRPAFYVKS